jgi:hypothetical protein
VKVPIRVSPRPIAASPPSARNATASSRFRPLSEVDDRHRHGAVRRLRFGAQLPASMFGTCIASSLSVARLLK